MRRLFSAGQVNPTLGTLAEVAAALGMRITVEPLPVADREQVTTSLLEGHSADTQTLVAHLAGMRALLAISRATSCLRAINGAGPGIPA